MRQISGFQNRLGHSQAFSELIAHNVADDDSATPRPSLLVDMFSGDDQFLVEDFIGDFERVTQAFGWTTLKQDKFGKQLLRGTAKSYIRLVGAGSWTLIRRELQAEFGNTISISDIHRQLDTRRRLPTATAQQFCISMRTTAKDRVDETDLIAYIIRGLTPNNNDLRVL